jgi:gliding motility-associated-like protein
VDTLGSPINYTWDFGNGNVSHDRTPPAQVYTRPGNYAVSLSVNTNQCPTPFNTIKQILVVDKPTPAVRYPVQYAVIGYPLELTARPFGATALWRPSNYLDEPASFKPIFLGSVDQLYTIDITTGSGCVTVDTQLVTAVKEAAIYVPSAFTPNHDGLNDVLRPVLMGIKELRYFRIFNRWGQLLYQSNSELPGWDGTSGGTPLATQVVVWMAEGISVDKRVITLKGTSTLLR